MYSRYKSFNKCIIKFFSSYFYRLSSLSWCHPWKDKSFEFWCSVISFFFFLACAFAVISKKPLPYPRATRVYPCVFSWGFYRFGSYIWVFHPFWVIFLCSVMSGSHFILHMLSKCPGLISWGDWPLDLPPRTEGRLSLLFQESFSWFLFVCC